MSYRVDRTCMAFAIALLCALALFSVARAQDSNTVATTITIEPLDPITTGKPVTIRAQLHTATNQKQGAVGNETLDLSVDGVHERRAKTDANGAISFSLPGNLPVGRHTIQIDYAGTQELLPSIATTELVIEPAARQPAQAAKTAASVLTINLINPLSVGEDGTVDVRLSTPSDANSGAVGNEVIQLFVDDKPVRRARTDADGKAFIHIPKDVELPSGKHTIRAEYPGTRALLKSSASTELSIAPAVVEIQITPALAGVRFTLDKHEFVSDQQGVARIEVDRVGDYPLEILPIASNNTDSRIEFSRWLDEVFTPHRKVTIPLRGPLHVGFNVYKRVSQRYLDLESKPVDSGRVTSLLLKSSQGMALKLTDNQSRWMQASSVARRTTGLEETKIQYSVDSVLVDGSNVVNQSQQRFYVQANDVWPIQLLLYTARFQARDALFKFPLGSGIHIEHPGGRIEEMPFGPNAELSIRSLVRGIYRVNVSGAPGISPISPIALSRDQDVQLLVISYLDIAIGAVLAAALGFGLLFIGRPKLFFMLGKPRVLVRAISSAPRTMLDAISFQAIEQRRRSIGASVATLIADMRPPRDRVRQVARPSGSALNLEALQGMENMRGDIAPLAAPERTSSLRRRFEHVIRYKPPQLTRRRQNSILACALIVALFIIVGRLPGPGAVGTQSAHAQRQSYPTVILPGALLSGMPMQPTATLAVPSTPGSGANIPFNRILRLTSIGDDVAQLQLRLQELGYFGVAEQSGYFGESTFRAVSQFQAKQGLQVTGVVDRQTIEALNSCGSDCIHLNRTKDNAQ